MARLLVVATDDRSKVSIVDSPDLDHLWPSRINGVWGDAIADRSFAFNAEDMYYNFGEVPEDEAAALNDEAKAALSNHPA